jgi:hypothetical protein
LQKIAGKKKPLDRNGKIIALTLIFEVVKWLVDRLLGG